MFRVRRIIAGVLSAALFVPLLAASTVVASSVVDPFSARFTTNTRGSIELIGNTLMTCPPSTTCTDALDGVGGTLNYNDFSNGTESRLFSGQRWAVGGSSDLFAAVVQRLDWVVPPQPQCAAAEIWSVGEVIQI